RHMLGACRGTGKNSRVGCSGSGGCGKAVSRLRAREEKIGFSAPGRFAVDATRGCRGCAVSACVLRSFGGGRRRPAGARNLEFAVEHAAAELSASGSSERRKCHKRRA